MKIRKDFFVPYLFLLPAIVLLLIFNFVPAVATLRESLYAESITRGADPIFVGLDNFARVFTDPVFWKSVQVTLLFNLLVNPLQTILALGLSLIANQRVSGIKYFRSIYLLPIAVSINVTAVVWGLMVDANGGLINGMLNQLGLPEQAFLTSPAQALWTIIMIISWKGIPYWALFQSLYLAALDVAQRLVAVLLVYLEAPTVTIRVGTYIRRIHHTRLHLRNTYTQAHLSSSRRRYAYLTTNFPDLETVTN